ncbi:MBL fold metallo-hydrolase [Schlesneria sp. DSM 10557]|uniref:MBL fold metallo-hydrolase n=1 Tax=Schlesneria sp. DSM 10557 TaxID=3044399 RepID=UPI0035A19E39
MPHYICSTCGTQYAETLQPPDSCLICTDERQYVKTSGQRWTTAPELRQSHRTTIKLEEPGLISIGIEPQFGIGQRAFFLRTPHGNVLWDCIPLLDGALVEMLNAMGGLAAIAISHPHYYSNVVEWSRAFGNIPVYLHAADRQWVMRPDDCIHFWQGETRPLLEGLTLIRCGGHFAGGSVLHWEDGAKGRGVLLSGDIIQVVADRKSVSFMYSYPNHIPLGPAAIQQIVNAVEPFRYDRIYGAFWDMVIERDGKTAVNSSAERYLQAIRQ